MKAEIKFVKTKDFIKTTASGQLNLDESKQVLAKLAALNSSDNLHDLLVDIRDTTSVLSLSDIYELVLEVSKQRHAFRKKIAIIIGPKHDIDKARFLEMCASNRGFTVNVFDDFEESVNWLMCEDEN
jgi:TFIIF-interacting CTD phosphatase-like protein